MLLGYQSSNYSNLPPRKLYFRPCGYRNVTSLRLELICTESLLFLWKFLWICRYEKLRSKAKQSSYHTKYGVRVGSSPVCIWKVMGSIHNLVTG